MKGKLIASAGSEAHLVNLIRQYLCCKDAGLIKCTDGYLVHNGTRLLVGVRVVVNEKGRWRFEFIPTKEKQA